MADLRPEHLDGMFASRQEKVIDALGELGEVRNVLTRAECLAPDLLAKLKEAPPRRTRTSTRKSSYSKGEFRRIVEAARSDLRAAAKRIRFNRELLQRFRDGEDMSGEHGRRRMELMDWVDRFGDVPRQTRKSGLQIPAAWVFSLGRVNEIVTWVHLSGLEAAAGAVLLAALTGENPGVIQDIRASHHRADGYTGDVPTAILGTRKLRRRSRAYMNLVLSDVPDWMTVPAAAESLSSRDELHTPFGVYALLHELTARSRSAAGSDQLLVGWSEAGGRGAGRGLRPKGGDGWVRAWADRHAIMADSADADSEPKPLRVTLDVIRLTYLELHQKPVAHTEKTLATTYLLRNRGNLVEYQKVVAAALEGEVAKARVRGVMAVLTREDVERVHHDVEGVAAKYGVDATNLKRMISGELDTVMNACVGHTTSPYAPPGEPCRASFMLCLGCHCARALPRHLPVQVLVHDRLEAGRQEMTALQWTERFALPHSQLTDLLRHHDEQDVQAARAHATEAEKALITRFVNRELDLR